MRSYRANQNLVAVSASSRETALNVAQTLDVTMLVDVGDIADIEPRRETNANELTGREEPDAVYDLGATSVLPLNYKKAQPQHFAFILAYALGQVSTAAAGTGYEHTITPIDGDLDGDRSNPTFTAAQRYGKTVLKRRFVSMAIDQFTASFKRDDWCQINAQAKGTGKIDTNMVEETVSALNNATSLTLAANGVEGADAAARLDNVHRVRAELSPGVWTEVAVSDVSADTPAVITITSPGGDGSASIDYRILYTPTEASWATFPSRVTESPLRVSEIDVTIGGQWDGSAFSGGRPVTSELNGLDWEFQNNMQVEFVPGAGGAYAGRIFRDGRTQALKLNREFRDYILQQHRDANDYFGVRLLAQGAVFDSPHAYQVELIWPRVAVLNAPLSVDGKRLAEAGDLAVLEDPVYGSVIARVKNLQAAYAA